MKFFTRRYEEWGFNGEYEVFVGKTIRLNTLKVKKISKSLNPKKISFLETGYSVSTDFSLASTPSYLHGEYYIQDSVTQMASEVLSPNEGDIVLDIAAAPGGKTTHLAQLMKNRGKIIALDTHPIRIKKLKNNLERCGVTNTLVFQKDAQYSDDLGILFDKVLLDAPCSGNFSLDSGWFEKREMEGIKNNARLQKKLLSAAVKVCKPKGSVLYCTCSLEIEENEEVIEWALEKLNVELLSIDKEIGVSGITERTKLCKRVWPGKSRGFFMALLQKKG